MKKVGQKFASLFVKIGVDKRWEMLYYMQADCSDPYGEVA